MFNTSLLMDLLGHLINEVPDLLAALIIDREGLVLAQQSVQGFNEEIIGAIMSVVDQTITKIKKFTETSFGSGTFDSNEFRLFYVELGGKAPVLFVLVAEPYSDIEKFIPYSYLVADKVSLILDQRETSINLPKVNQEGIINHHHTEASIGQNIHSKIVIIGDSAVGKSSLVEIYTKGELKNPEYKPTIGISINQKDFQLSKRIKMTYSLFDMSGSRSFTKVRKFYYTDSNAVLILFDYTKIKTLENITEWLEEAHYYVKDMSIPYLLIGNKIDLVENRDAIKNKAEQLANEYSCSFFETSSLTGEGIDELFTSLISNLENK